MNTNTKHDPRRIAGEYLAGLKRGIECLKETGWHDFLYSAEGAHRKHPLVTMDTRENVAYFMEDNIILTDRHISLFNFDLSRKARLFHDWRNRDAGEMARRIYAETIEGVFMFVFNKTNVTEELAALKAS